MNNTNINTSVADISPSANQNISPGANFAQPNKKPIGLIVALAISCTTTIGLGVFCLALILSNNPNNKEKCVTVADNSQNSSNSSVLGLNSLPKTYGSAVETGERNTSRKADMAQIASAIYDFQANNNGKLPFNYDGEIITQTMKNGEPDFTGDNHVDRFAKRYLNAGEKDSSGEPKFQDPLEKSYDFSIVKQLFEGEITAIEGYDVNYHVQIFLNAKCGKEEGEVEYSVNERDYAIGYVMENNYIYCADGY